MVGTPRQTQFQHVHYLRKKVMLGDAGLTTGVLVGTLPAGAIIGYDAQINVTTAFDATSTNVMVVGTTVGGNDVSADAVSAAGVAGTKRMSTADALGPVAADTDIWVKYTQSGTAATVGTAYILIPFYPNNDR